MRECQRGRKTDQNAPRRRKGGEAARNSLHVHGRLQRGRAWTDMTTDLGLYLLHHSVPRRRQVLKSRVVWLRQSMILGDLLEEAKAVCNRLALEDPLQLAICTLPLPHSHLEGVLW